ncbi:MAG: gliding motility-associated C-terminal domain-containing protein [Bacteroidia bacterium]|nr:gliding motility-associated C-terminal domain-containing protein [uncultured Flavobacterium sp.]MBP6755932.1 gliding motility-associated C-terminal domain-containing protein [Bacteroidia bacterium]
MRISIVDKYFFCFLTLVLSLTTTIHAQVITPQNLEISKICAGSHNQFDATFNYSGFPALTTFEVELSDNLGSFTNPTTTTTLATVDLSVSKKTINFAVPATLIGSETYSLRVKSSTGLVSAKFNNRDLTTSFPAYYKPYEDVYFINNKNPAAYLCSGGTITLAIDNPTPSIPNSSPSNYPNIKYKWYKDATVIAGQTGSSIIVNSAGTYYVEIDYASCTDSNSKSNSVTVTQVSGTVLPITSSLGNPFCSGGVATTLTSASGNTYQWYKENVKIEGATENTYQTNQSGTYSVSIDYGNCQSNSVINLEAYQIESSINIASTSTLVSGETKTVVATSNAINPTYEWYQNDVLISGATSNTYDVTIEGTYKVIVTQNSGCIIQDEIPFVVNPVVDSNVTTIPNLISPNNDGINDTWVIPQEYAVGNNAEVLLMDSNGEIVLKTNDYLNNWPEAALDFKNINPVYYYIITTQDKKVKKGSITIVK